MGNVTLSPSELRCMGLIPTPFAEMRCTRRNTCARFLERYAEGVTVDLMRLWMCPGLDDYWQFFIQGGGDVEMPNVRN